MRIFSTFRSAISLLLFFIVLSTVAMAQQPAQVNYQGVARKADGSPVSDQQVTLRLSIHDGGANSPIVYSETRTLNTNKFGLFTTVIGSPGANSQSGSMNTVAWASGNKFLRVELDPAGGTSFQDLGISQLQSVPYAIFASQALPAGTAAGDLGASYPNPTVTRIQGSPVSTVAPQNGQVLTWNGTTWTPANAGSMGGQAITITANLPLNASTGNGNTSLSLSKSAANSDGYLSQSDWILFNNKTSKGYVDAAIATVSVADATMASTGKIQLAGDLNGTAAAPLIADGKITTSKLADGSVTDSKISTGINPSKLGLGNVNNTSDAAKPVSNATQLALDARELLSNKSVNMITDAISDTKYPSVKSVKTYVDAATTPDADATNKGKIQLAGDFSGTAAAPVIAAGAVNDAKIAADAAITDTKLATIITAGKVANSATTATSVNTVSTIVVRDPSGNFAAGNITASLTGTASLAAHIAGGSAGLIPFQSAANTTALLSAGTAGQVLQSNGAAAPSWVTPGGAVREVADEATATAAQTSFTLSQTPSANSKVKMFVNGIRISNTAYSSSSTTLTYVPANNGGYSLTAGDRVQFDYYY